MTRWEAQEASSCAAEKEICSDALLKVFSLNYRSTAACSECYQNINYLSLFTELHFFYICLVPRHRCSLQRKKGMSWQPDELGLGLGLVLDLLPNKCAAIIQKGKE